MTSSPQRRPLDSPPDPRSSTAMVLARYANPPDESSPDSGNPKRIALKAGALALLCASLAFVFFSTADMDSKRRSSPTAKEVLGTQPAERPSDARTMKPAATPTTISLPQDPGRRVTEFILAKSSDFQHLGPVSLRLNEVDVQRNTYDLSLKTDGEELNKKGGGANQSIKVGKTDGGAEVVVGAILQNRVWGYLSEPKDTGSAHSNSGGTVAAPLQQASAHKRLKHGRHARATHHRRTPRRAHTHHHHRRRHHR